MRGGTPRVALLGAMAAIAAMGSASVPGEAVPSPEMPKMNRQGGGHHGSKPLSDSTHRIRARKRWEKKRKRDSRRGVYTVRGCRA